LRAPGTKRVHFQSESDAARRRFLTELAHLHSSGQLSAHLYVSEQRRDLDAAGDPQPLGPRSGRGGRSAPGPRARRLDHRSRPARHPCRPGSCRRSRPLRSHARNRRAPAVARRRHRVGLVPRPVVARPRRPHRRWGHRNLRRAEPRSAVERAACGAHFRRPQAFGTPSIGHRRPKLKRLSWPSRRPGPPGPPPHPRTGSFQPCAGPSDDRQRTATEYPGWSSTHRHLRPDCSSPAAMRTDGLDGRRGRVPTNPLVFTMVLVQSARCEANSSLQREPARSARSQVIAASHHHPRSLP